MSFSRYPAYKDSGVEWLGEMPGHWKAVPLKAVTSHNDEVLDEATAPDTEITYVDISSVDGVNGIKTKEEMLFAAAPSRARRCVKHGDVIVSTVRTYLKAIARIRDPEVNLVVSTGFAVIRPRGELTPDFLGHLVSAGFFVDQVIARSTGVSYPAINASALVAIPVLVPPLLEQAQIATFLDRETAKIDALVAEQRRLMALLKEKRQAVISHAVTRGLNPKAPMKPSGVEWLGEVPGHWEIKRLKQACQVFPSNVDKKSYDGEIPVQLCNYTDVYYNDIIVAKMDFMAATATVDQIAKFTLRAGDTIITKDSETADDIAIAAYVPADLPGVICGYHLSMIRPTKDADGSFVKRLFDSTYVKSSVAVRANGLTRVGLGQYEIDNLDLPFPPLPEQIQIAAFLDRETAQIDGLISAAEHAIDLLAERRTALISAAVTGQIDVRTAVLGKLA